MLKAIPDNSPIIAANIVCSQCGNVLLPKVVMVQRGKDQVADHVEYTCINEERGCRYKVETNVMLQAEMMKLREDGTEARLPR